MAVKTAKARPIQLSEEYVHDSSDEDDGLRSDTGSESGRESGAAMRHSSANVPKSNGVVESSEDEDESEGEAASMLAEDEHKSNQSENNDGASSNSQSSEDSTDNRKRSRERGDAMGEAQPRKKQKTKKRPPPPRVPSKPFDAPTGFERLVFDASDYASAALDTFSDLRGKQVWHISAPASVNIGSITELDISAALKGGSIVTQDRVSYGMQPTARSDEILLLPTDADGNYQLSATKISKSFLLKVIDIPVTIDNRHDDPANARRSEVDKLVFTAQNPGQGKPAREQPQGLKSRYTPFGVLKGGKRTSSVATPPTTNGSFKPKASSMKTDQTPSKTNEARPSEVDDAMDIDTELPNTKTTTKSPEPSPVKSSGPDTPRQKKKKKKRSKLVDVPDL